MKACVCLVVEGPSCVDATAGVTVFSGFIIEVCDEWFWITADHVFDDAFGKLDQVEGDNRFRLYLASTLDRTRDPINFRFAQSNRIRMPEVARAWLPRVDEPLAAARFRQIAPDLDIAAMHLDNYYVSLLRTVGVEPLRSEHYRSDIDLAKIDLSSYVCAVVGAPQSEVKLGKSVGQFTIRALELQPYFGEDVNCDPPFVAFQPCWTTPDFDDNVAGMSGGPIFISNGLHTILIGVQFAAKPARNPRYIRALSAEPFIQLLEHVVHRIRLENP